MFNISKADKSLAELLRITSFIITEICEKKYMAEATEIPLSVNQYYILRVLSNSSPFNLSDLAKILLVSNAAVGKNIDKLVNYKLVTRRFTKKDRRSAKISITQEGQDVVEKYHHLKLNKQAEIFTFYTEQEKEKFSNYLRSFIHNTLDENENTDLLCLQCNGSCGDDCIVRDKKGTCARKH